MNEQDENKLIAERKSKLAFLREEGNPFVNDFQPKDLAQNLHKEFDEVSNRILEQNNNEVSLAGRIMLKRVMGKASFVHLQDSSGQIQLFVTRDELSEGIYDNQFKKWDIGDIVGVTGSLFKTKTGELSVRVNDIRLLTKSLRPLPEKFHGLSDQETIYRQRYVDLIMNEKSRKVFQRRSQIIAYIRKFFIDNHYLEVETPMMQVIPGGARAKPFITHHKALDMELFLRIAPELYLKRLLVGGIERVFELARVFRNEGLSNRHNPEFTMLEFYQAFSDYQGMLELTEELVINAAKAAGLEQDDGSISAQFRDEQFDLRAPFARIKYADAFKQYVGIDACDREALGERLAKEEIAITGEGDYFWWKAVNNLFERFVEPELRGPIFVTDYPSAICPLAKPSKGDPTWAERFEFFLGGMELANAFSELNDPQLQLENFEGQVGDADPEAPNAIDHDYVRALGYGMPPAGGCGIGVDRLVMVLLNCDTIRDVLLFPHLRPETEE